MIKVLFNIAAGIGAITIVWYILYFLIAQPLISHYRKMMRKRRLYDQEIAEINNEVTATKDT